LNKFVNIGAWVGILWKLIFVTMDSCYAFIIICNFIQSNPTLVEKYNNLIKISVKCNGLGWVQIIFLYEHLMNKDETFVKDYLIQIEWLASFDLNQNIIYSNGIKALKYVQQPIVATYVKLII